MSQWWLYIVRCRNGALYTGISNDVNTRIDQHNAGKGAKYTRSFGPVKLVYAEVCLSVSFARKREAEVKKLTKQQKEDLVRRSFKVRMRDE